MESSGDRPAPPDGAFSPFELLGPVGARPQGAYLVRGAAVAGARRPHLVSELFRGAALDGAGQETAFVREARRIAVLTNLNVGRVQSVSVKGPDVAVYSEAIEGERLVELWSARPLPLDVTLRWILDVLSGLATLHTLRDAKQQPLKLAHGEVSTATIAIGVDGVAKLLHSVARRVPGAGYDPASLGYMAPEVLAGEAFDARADVFGAGVLLWEALDGGRLFAETDAPAVVSRVRRGEVAAPTLAPKAEWARSLVDVALRAVKASPDDRWPTAAAMAAELRKGAGLKLAPASTAAAFTRGALGDRAKARAERWATLEPVGSPSPAAPKAAPRKPEPVAPTPVVDEISGVQLLPSSDFMSAPVITPRVEVPVATPRVAAVVPAGAQASGSPPPAPVAEVVELGSESLLDAPDSIPPPSATPASALGGFVIDPFASGARRGPATFGASPAPPPPPVEIVAPPPVQAPTGALPPPTIEPPDLHEVSEASPVSGAPAFASAIASPADVAAPPTAPAPRKPGPVPRLQAATVRIQRMPDEVKAAIARAQGKGSGSPLKTMLLGGGAGLVVVVVGLLLFRPSAPPPAPGAAASDRASTPVAAPPPIDTAFIPSPSGAPVVAAPAEPATSASAAPSPTASAVAAAPGVAKAATVSHVAPPPRPAAPPAKKRTSFTPDTL